MDTVATYLRPAFPWAVGLIGTVLVSVGTLAQLDQDSTAYSFGIIPSSRDGSKSKTLSSVERTFIRTTGVRDIMSGTALISLVTFWQFSEVCKNNLVAYGAVQKALGVYMVVGAIGGTGDGYMVNKYGRDPGVSKEAADRAGERQSGHFIGAVACVAIGAAMFFL